MPASPPVSVCLVTYNRAEVLPATVESILSQSFGDFELIISDDCSVDHTREVCREFASRDRRVVYVRNERNLGMPGNLNSAIVRAGGHLIAHLHDGDLFDASLIRKWKDALDMYPAAGFATCLTEQLDATGASTGQVHTYWRENPVSGARILHDMLLRTVSPIYGIAMVRRSAYDEVGLYDPRFGIISDVDMWLRLAAISDMALVSEPLIKLRPREPDHPWNFVTWRVFIPTHEEIIRTNLVRRYGAPNRRNAPQWRRFHLNYSRRIITQLLADAVHARTSQLADALEYFPVSGIPFWAALGRAVRSVRRCFKTSET